jgi:CPA2 family monovalent cation:H+ antiporter-2
MQADFNVIWIFAVGLSCASLLGYFAQRIRLSPILGYLLAGYLIGPYSPGFVADLYMSEQLAHIGVTLLMFAVGLHFNWKDILAVKKIAVPGALTLGLFSIATGFLLSSALGESWATSLVIGAAICVSSTVVIVKVLTDQDLLHTPQGHIVVGWTIMDDLLAIFVLVFLPTIAPFTTGNGASADTLFSTVTITALKVIGLILFVYFIADRVIQQLLQCVARSRSHELFTLAILSTVFVVAVGSSYIFGVSLALGAFIAGTVVGKTNVSQQAAANALPMRDAFSVIFFLSIGMLFNPQPLINNLVLFFGILFTILCLRTSLAFCIVRALKYPVAVAATVAIAIGQIGEYSFILVEEADRLDIIPDKVYDIIVACSLISISLNPLLFQLFKPLTSKQVKRFPLESLPASAELFKIAESNTPILVRAIVVGYGTVGETAADCLKEKGYSVLIIEQNVDTVAHLKRQTDFQALFGDAEQLLIMEMANLESVQLIVITPPEARKAKGIIQTVRHLNPYIQVIARTRFKKDTPDFENIDVPVACDEEASAKEVKNLILHHIGEVAI